MDRSDQSHEIPENTRACSTPKTNHKSQPHSQPTEPSSQSIDFQREEEFAALAGASALVGESILDSPQSSPRILQMDDRDNQGGAGVPPPILGASSRSHPLTTDNANAMSVGIMAQGLAWVRRQREVRQRLYLQNQAEQQLLKIQRAQLAEEQAKNRSLADNATFQNILRTKPGLESKHSQESCNSENNSERSNDNDDAGGGVSRVSKSGDGISVALPSLYSTTKSAHQDEDESDASFIPPVRVVEDIATNSNDDDDEDGKDAVPFVLTPEQMHQIATNVLPRGIAYCQWKRLYSLARDGDAFDACLRCIHDHSRTLLVVRTARNDVFGGFADSVWEPHHKGGACYFGGSSACLFRIDPATQKVKHYKWSGANHYVQFCDASHKMLAFGGGGSDGAFGLCLQEDFQVGSTGTCATFNNEPLCEQENFEIVDMEIFGFLLGQF